MSELNAVQKTQLNILIELDRVCRKHGLKYFLAFGSCLGALRHKGFIPWDDDIDVLMPFADVKRLFEYRGELGDRYFLQSRVTDPEYCSIAARLRDSNTTCIEEDEQDLKINHGIYIDIYPYYDAPATKWGLLLNILRSHIYKILVSGKPPRNHGKALAYVARVILTLIPEEKRKAVIIKLESKIQNVKDGKYILDYFGQDISLFSAIIYPKEWFSETRETEFEDYMFFIPIEAEEYMKKRYGDYMVLPPENERKHHHSYVKIDPYKSYVEYEGDR